MDHINMSVYISSLHNQDEYSLFQSALLLLPCCFATKIRECTARMHKLNNFHTGQKRILSPFLYSYDRDLHPCIWLLCKGPFFYCHEERHFTWHCHFSVIVSCEMTVSGEMTVFVTVEKWTQTKFYHAKNRLKIKQCHFTSCIQIPSKYNCVISVEKRRK